MAFINDIHLDKIDVLNDIYFIQVVLWPYLEFSVINM